MDREGVGYPSGVSLHKDQVTGCIGLLGESPKHACNPHGKSHVHRLQEYFDVPGTVPLSFTEDGVMWVE